MRVLAFRKRLINGENERRITWQKRHSDYRWSRMERGTDRTTKSGISDLCGKESG